MAYTTINKSTDYFNTKLYEGNGSSPRSITGVGFQPDWTWTKNRDNTNGHGLFDAVRGYATGKGLSTHNTNAEGSADGYGYLSSRDSDGYTMTAGGSSMTMNNTNGESYVSWNWKAGTTSIPSGSTSDPSAVSINTTAGFGIYKITAPGSGNYVLKHGLGATPAMVIVKRTDGTQKWMVWHKTFSNATDDYLSLNSNAAKATYSTCWGTMNSTDCTIATGGTLDTSAEHIIYVFTEKTGYSKFGSYTGNGNADGTFVYTGFKPSWLMIKQTNSTENWHIFDIKRNPYYPTSSSYGGMATRLMANLNNADDLSQGGFRFLSNGLKMTTSWSGGNGSGDTFIYMCFGQSLVGLNNTPCTSR
tara:strand:- start:29 stop:1105 length:1077 start_codon:yes stop_codon:yes gene_type:complete